MKLEEERDALNSQYDDLKQELIDIERSASLILQNPDEILSCIKTSDLKIVKSKLESFLKRNKEIKNNISEIRSIFDEIKRKEKDKISKLLSKESSIMEYFEEITNGLYKEIIFTLDPFEIKIKRKDNQILDLNQLSGGTFDQLYFSIRLALGEKVLQDQPGFFILDDPFIKSDSSRLSNQVNLLKKISSLGWQILYFTCKDEIVNSLDKEIQNNQINYLEFNSLVPEDS